MGTNETLLLRCLRIDERISLVDLKIARQDSSSSSVPLFKKVSDTMRNEILFFSAPVRQERVD